jgi:hypothetical protein
MGHGLSFFDKSVSTGGYVDGNVIARASSRALEVILVLAMLSIAVYAVVRPVLGPAGLSIGAGPEYRLPSVPATLTVGITTQPSLPQIGSLGYAEGDAIEMGGPYTAHVSVVNPTLRQRIAIIGPGVLGGLVTLVVLFLLLQLVRSLRLGDPFRRANAHRLLGIAALVGVGGQAVVLLDVWGRAQIMNHPTVAPFVTHDERISYLPLIAGFGIAVAAEVFRQGARLREEVEGTV